LLLLLSTLWPLGPQFGPSGGGQWSFGAPTTRLAEAANERWDEPGAQRLARAPSDLASSRPAERTCSLGPRAEIAAAQSGQTKRVKPASSAAARALAAAAAQTWPAVRPLLRPAQAAAAAPT